MTDKNETTKSSQQLTNCEAIYKNHRDNVFRLVLRLCHDWSAAESITQEVFLRFHKETHAGENIVNPLGWLLRVGRNLAFDERKRSSPRYCRSYEQYEPDSRQAGPGDRAAADEEYEMLHAALEKLPPDYREVLILRYFFDFSRHEIARRMQRTPPSVQGLLHRATERLRELLRHPDVGRGEASRTA